MSGITLLIALQTGILAADPGSYEAAFNESRTKDKPLMVLVGATWCGGCQTMKQNVLPFLAKRGDLDKVSYAAVDADAEPELARSLLKGPAIPILIVFSRKSTGEWHREQMIGIIAEADIKALIGRAVAGHQPAPATEQTAGGGN